MPELPEIETIKNGLSRFVLFKKIKEIHLVDPKLFIGKKNTLKLLANDELTQIDRRGKALIFSFKKSADKILIHLKMTGQLVYFADNKKRKNIVVAGGHSEKSKGGLELSSFRHIRLKIKFNDQSFLILNDSRRFAYLRLLDQELLKSFNEQMGVEPLSSRFTIDYLFSILKGKRKNVKAFLLDQKYIAGIGNIYADEILFASQISPFRSVDTLRAEEVKKIYLNTKKILKLAIKRRGTTFNDYVDASGDRGSFLSLLKVYGRQGKACQVCAEPIKKTRLAGRGTHYCPKCQS